MSTTPSPSQYEVNLEDRNAKAHGQASAAPSASSSSQAAPPAPASTKTRKVPRKKRLHKMVKELKKAHKSALLSPYITRKFQVLYETYLSEYHLSEADAKNLQAKEKRAKLRDIPGYNEALITFRQEKESFILGLVPLSQSEIDAEAAKFFAVHGEGK